MGQCLQKSSSFYPELHVKTQKIPSRSFSQDISQETPESEGVNKEGEQGV